MTGELQAWRDRLMICAKCKAYVEPEDTISHTNWCARVEQLRDEVERQRGDVERARFVAVHWGDAAITMVERGQREGVMVAVALGMVLFALDGVTDPKQVGLTPDAHEAFRAIA